MARRKKLKRRTGDRIGCGEARKKLFTRIPSLSIQDPRFAYSKMTVLSNHRIHSYKRTAAHVRRDVSPKKMPVQRVPLLKKNRALAPKMMLKLMALLKETPQTVDYYVVPQPSAPPAEMMERTICVWGMPYQIALPMGFDIYEGLRRWYPSLYMAVIEEEENLRTLSAMEEGLTEEDVEQAWAHQDYLEWLCD
jgi:hypothetical protein